MFLYGHSPRATETKAKLSKQDLIKLIILYRATGTINKIKTQQTSRK